MRLRWRYAFTVVELLVVIAIIGVIVALILPNAFKSIEKARISRLLAEVKAIKTAGYLYYADTGDWPKWGEEFYDPGVNDDYGFKYFMEPDNSGRWNGPYLEKLPTYTPWGGRYRYWKSRITGIVYDMARNPIPVNNTKCAVVTIGGFKSAELRDTVDQHIRESIGYSYVGEEGGTYYISVIIWMER